MNIFYKLLIIVLAVVMISACSFSKETTNDQSKESKVENQESQEKEESEQPTSEGETSNEGIDFQADDSLTSFKHSFLDLVNEANENGTLQDIETKDELVNYFKQFMSEDLAIMYANTYFKEESEGVSVKATDAPTWLDLDKPYEVKNVNKQEYIVTQEKDNELTGHIELSYTFKHTGENWIVEDIQQEKVVNELKPKLEDPPKKDINSADAEDLVRKYLNFEGNNLMNIRVDHEEDTKYVVQVYEVVEQEGVSHTATYGWYYVDKKTGKIENMMN
ncbi:hypothetical protein [Bacillus weihaiensis]|uniref:hypothetical protein n=1 Tax=Bacillus weihaiensis TaxID=1547283 RepID=UPI002352090F|nr:hypothetical protein [Bacillus weihaiensis]